MGRVLGYIEGGAGVIWENIDSISYSHCFNFSPQVGAGVDIKIVQKLCFVSGLPFSAHLQRRIICRKSGSKYKFFYDWIGLLLLTIINNKIFL